MTREITKIVIHCSLSPHRGDTAADVHAWHLNRGWDGIGYHYTIDEHGGVEAGRPLYWVGSHTRGYNNGSIGVMLFGESNFTTAQYDALLKLMLELPVEL